MPWYDPTGADVATHHVQIFIPSVDRGGRPVPRGQQYWVEESLKVLAGAFGGATAFPPGVGAWHDKERDVLVFDETAVVFSYAADQDLTGAAGDALRAFLMRLGREGRQGEVGVYIDGQYIRFHTFDDAPSEDEEDPNGS